MTNKYLSVSFQLGDLSLPDVATTRNGVVFTPRATRWVYRDGGKTISLNFSSIAGISKEFLLGMKLTLLWYAENLSPAHTISMFSRAKHFVEIVAVDKIVSEITSADLMNYRAKLDASTQWYLGALSGFLKKWYRLGIPGINNDAIDLLKEIRLSGNRKGGAVLTMDPVMGPYTDVERNALHAALNMAYANGSVDTADYLLCLLIMVLGQRPIQYSHLKVCDVRDEMRADGSFVYILRMPRAKQRGELPRSTFKERIIIPQIGRLLLDYSKVVRKRFVGRLQDARQAPLFPDARGTAAYAEGFEFHQTALSIYSRVIKVFEKFNVVSERTSEPIHVAPIRFRRTIGTQAAVEGHGELIIAELLDHSDTQNVGVYVAATPEIAERIDRAVAAILAPLAQAFAGVLVDGKTEQEVPPAQRIVAPQYSKNFSLVGACGQHGFCGFTAPIACYTCLNFRAWLDGPHEAVLDHLVADRERLMKTDSRIATVNDRTILAVAQVVEMCKAAQA